MPNDENSEKQVFHRDNIGAGDISASVLHLVVRDPNHPLEDRVRPRPQYPTTTEAPGIPTSARRKVGARAQGYTSAAGRWWRPGGGPIFKRQPDVFAGGLMGTLNLNKQRADQVIQRRTCNVLLLNRRLLEASEGQWTDQMFLPEPRSLFM